MNQTKSNQQDVSFFGKMLTFSRIKLATNDFDIIEKQLQMVSPEKNSLLPIVIDTDVDIDLKKLTDLLWEWGLQPIGVVKGLIDEQATEMKMALFPADGKRIQRVTVKAPPKVDQNLLKSKLDNNAESEAEKKSTDSTEVAQSKALDTDSSKSQTNNDSKQKNKQQITDKDKPNSPNDKQKTTNITAQFHTEQTKKSLSSKETMKKVDDNDTSDEQLLIEQLPEIQKITSLVHDQMLRSGQSVNHVGGDLILTNSVNDGAEAITDNSLHIYGKGMGRLVAGATGDEEAHIFCQRFNPSLVSVAGTYMLRDSIPAEFVDKPVQVSYKEGEGLVFRIMNDWIKNHTKNNINNG